MIGLSFLLFYRAVKELPWGSEAFSQHAFVRSGAGSSHGENIMRRKRRVI